ncbi:MAG: hypothetical protein WBG01_10540 [Bacteroidota bacterium]
MNRPIIVVLILVAGLHVGCSTWPGEDSSEAEPRRQLELARRLQASGAIREATHEYTIVAEQYPTAGVHATAVRKVAQLYANPSNPLRNDSTATAWLEVHLGLDISGEEREASALLIERIRETAELRKRLTHHTIMADSMASVTLDLAAATTKLTRQTNQLRSELRDTREELNKLKEIDAQTSKSRRRP